MFNSCVAAHNLLQRRLDCGILKAYSMESCFILCHTIVDGVIKTPEGTTQTLNHLHFALEVIGFSYSLPIEYRSIDIIQKSINIYEMWLKNCPKCAQSCEQSIIKDILGHFSLLFHNLAPSSMIDSHTILSLKVISVIHTFIVNRGHELESTSWNHCIRLLLGGGDSIFEGPVVSEGNLGSNIAIDYIRLVFEVYLRSLPTVGLDLELWGLLDKFMLRWSHRVSLIKQWNAICMCLTAQIIRHYKRSEHQLSAPLAFISQPPLLPADLSHIRVAFPSQWKYLNSADGPSYVNLSPRELKFGWHRLLHCLRNPNTVLHNKDSPVILSNQSTRPQFVLAEAIFGVSTLCDEILTNMYPSEDMSLHYSIRNRGLLTTGPGRDTVDTAHLRLSYQRFRESNPTTTDFLPHIVSTNTLLMLFGGWLFEAALRIQSTGDADGEEARAIALGALGRIFTSKFLACYQSKEKPLLTPHRDRYLLAMKCALDFSKISFSKKILATALLTSHRIMGVKIDGVEILCVYTLKAIEEVILSSRENSTLQKQTANKMKFRLHSTPEANNEAAPTIDPNGLITTCPDVLSTMTPRLPEIEEELKEAQSKISYYGDVPLNELRRACIILAIGACVRRSSRVVLSDQTSQGNDNFPGCGVSTLLKLLKSENDSINLQLIIWTIPCLPMFNPGWSDVDHKARIEMVTSTLLLLKSSEVSYDVKFVILRMLGDLPSLYETAPRHLHPIDLAVTILNGLCGFISSITGDQMHPPTTTLPRSTGVVKTLAKPGRIASPRNSENEQSPFQKRRSYLLIDCAFLAVFEWISRIMDHHLITNRSGQAVLNKLQEVSVSFLNSVPHYFSSQTTNGIEKGLCSNAFRIIDHMLSRAGQYPLLPHGSASNTCHLLDKNGSQLFEKEDKFYHYLVDDEVILSIGELNQIVAQSSQSRNTSLLVITRNQFGKYLHEISSLSSLELHSEQPVRDRPHDLETKETFTPSCNGLLAALQVAKDRNDLLMNADSQHNWLTFSGNHCVPQLSFQSIQKGLTSPLDTTSAWYNPFVARLRKQEEIEKSFDQSNPIITQTSEISASTSNDTTWNSLNLFIRARHFLTQNRFISSSCHGQILPIPNTRNFLEKLHSLDDCPNRDQLEVWIAYARNDMEMSLDDSSPHQHIQILTGASSLNEYNTNYIKFLEGLGWLVELSSHTGYNADIDPSIFTGQLLYYASTIEEIIFHQHVWPLKTKSPDIPAIFSRDRIHASNAQRNAQYDMKPTVLILWNQCSQQIYPNSTLWEAYGLAPVEELILIIDPLVESESDGLYRIRTYTPENSFYSSIPEQVERIFGPLIDGMVVSLSHLSILLRRVIINTHRDRIYHSYHFETQTRIPPIPPLVARQRIINHIRNENVEEQSLVSFTSELLFHR